MISLLLVAAAASADLDALDQQVTRCDRAAASPTFAADAARRAQFLLDAYREQEEIVSARTDLSSRRRAWRESDRPSASADKQLKLEEAALDDRQKMLNDQRMLEGIRKDAMDSMRHYFLINCPAGKDVGR